MILQFPDFETFRFVLSSGAVPTVISLAPAMVSFPEGHGPAIEIVHPLPKAIQVHLKKLGVQTLKGHPGALQEVSSWLQVLPVVKDPRPPQLSSQSPVLFEITAVEQLPHLIHEMLRLGNDRQSYRWLRANEVAAGEPSTCVLLRVIGPPYYTLLQAIDPPEGTHSQTTVRAYVEKAPRVWVEIGYDHPFASHIQAPPGQMVLMRAPRIWKFLDDAPFHDVYEIVHFALPGSAVEWQESLLPEKLVVPLRLVAGNAADIPELWVLRRNAVDQLDQLVRDADDRLLQRLAFAVATDEGQPPTIVLRVRPSKLPVPTLELPDAIGFRPYVKLPNLFLPIGTRLQPTLRRDAIRKLLADDLSQLVWLYPQENGRFVPESLPDDAFRPLDEWISYVIDHDREPLSKWIQATRFDFDAFLCPEETTATPKGPGGANRNRSRKDGEFPSSGTDDANETPSPSGGKSKKRSRSGPNGETNYALPALVAAPSELKQKREELENRFLELDGPLDAPERLQLWPELAFINAQLGETNDAAIAWLNIFWETDPIPEEWINAWVIGELKGEPCDFHAERIDTYLRHSSLTEGELRAFIAQLMRAVRKRPVPREVLERLPQIQAFLEKHEDHLSVRAAWLMALTLTPLTGNDVLRLARCRDRLLQRLLENGLNPERDLPTFLRFAGMRDSERMRLIRERVTRLHILAQRWCSGGPELEVNRPYIDLLFAFGLARLGESTAARNLQRSAADQLENRKDAQGNPDAVHQYLLQAFRYRIEQAISGKAPTGSLPRELTDAVKKMSDREKYIIERLSQDILLLEPQEQRDPYRLYTYRYADDLYAELTDLADLTDAIRLSDRIRKVLRHGLKGQKTPEVLLNAMIECLPLSPRVSEAFCYEILQQLPGIIRPLISSTETKVIERTNRVLERAIFLAAHYDRVEMVQQLVTLFGETLRARRGKVLYDSVNLVAGECLRSLRKLGLRDEIQRLLREMSEQVLEGKSLAQLRAHHLAAGGNSWPTLLRTLLHLAGGFLYFGANDQAEPILDEARAMLWGKDRSDILLMDQARLAGAYATALSHGPVDEALHRLEELLSKMDRLPHSYTTTSSHYSRVHLIVIADVVRALVSDDFALGQTARRWLDDDEFLVRRRIHRDMKRMLEKSGL